MKAMNWNEYQEIVNTFSAIHAEPEWMRQLRLNALEKLATLPLPKIDRVKVERLPLFNVGELLEESAATGEVFAFDQAKDGPLLVQKGNITLIEQLPAKLIEKGVIFTDIFTALTEHEELVKEAYMQLAVKMDEDRLTAFHAAFMNSGLFLYVPKNIQIKEPFEAIFMEDPAQTAVLAKHILILAEENSELLYLERFQQAEQNENKAKRSANIVVEVIAKAGAKVKFSAIDQLSDQTTAYINRRGHILRDASIDWALGIMNDGDIVADFDSDLVGNGSHSEVKVVAISSHKQIQGIDTRVTNQAPYSVGHILQHGVIREKGTLTFNGIGHILKGAKGADAQQESRVLMLSDHARGDANPILLIDENEVTAGHAASVGRVDPEEMYYLMSRGLSRSTAERLVIRGFLGSVVTAIPVKEVQAEFINVIERRLS